MQYCWAEVLDTMQVFAPKKMIYFLLRVPAAYGWTLATGSQNANIHSDAYNTWVYYICYKRVPDKLRHLALSPLQHNSRTRQIVLDNITQFDTCLIVIARVLGTYSDTASITVANRMK